MYCKSCDQEKDDSEFPNNRSKVSGKGFYCNKCMYERTKAWRKKHPEKVAVLQKRYWDKRRDKGNRFSADA